MNILFYYSSTINPLHGGIQKVTSFLGNHFKTLGMNVYYLSSKKTSEDIEEFQFYLPKSTPNESIENEKYFIEFIENKHIDIVINQAAITPSEYGLLYWIKKTNAKLISALHSSLFGLYGVTNHFEKIQKILTYSKTDKFVNRCLNLYFKTKYQKFYKAIVQNSNKVVLLSDKFYNEIEYFSGMKNIEKNIISIPNPTTTNFIPKIEIKEPVLLFVGRITFTKRLDLLIKIWERIFNKYPDWNLVIVGDGDKKQDIMHMVEQMNLERIQFEGYQSPERYYEKSSIFCMTSSFEGFGLVLVEAMAYGVVPFAFNSYANVGDIIDDNVNGILVSPFSIEEYANKITQIIENETLRKEMSKNAINKSKFFDINSISAMWQNLFLSLKS